MCVLRRNSRFMCEMFVCLTDEKKYFLYIYYSFSNNGAYDDNSGTMPMPGFPLFGMKMNEADNFWLFTLCGACQWHSIFFFPPYGTFRKYSH